MSTRAWCWIAAAALVAAGLCAYANSLAGPFVFDDGPSILSNPTIRRWPELGAVLRPPPNGQTTAGRPVLNLSLALNYAAGGYQVRGYHVTNLAIHLLAGLTLFGIVRRTLNRGALPVAFGAALLWLVHPLQTEAVTYVAQRAESLMGLFYLLTLYSFVRGTGGGPPGPAAPATSVPAAGQARGGWLWASVVCCGAGMATKEVMVSAPVIVLLYDRTFVAGSLGAAWKRRRGYYLALASSWALLAALVAAGGGDRNGSMGIGTGITWPQYVLTQFPAIAHYLRLAVWPHPLVFEYGPFRVASPATIVPAAALVTALLVFTLVALRRRPAAGFLGAWFFAILAPTSLIPGATQMIVEHRMYLPLAAITVLAACAVHRLAGSAAGTAGAFLVLGGFAAAATRARNATYASGLTLWSDTVSRRPGNALAHNNLAIALGQLPGRREDAIREFKTALALKPDYADGYNNLGLTLAQAPGRAAEALACYGAALRLRPRDAEFHDNLGNALARLPGRAADAIAEYQSALRLRPAFAQAHNNLGNALAQIPGRLGEALAEFHAALKVDPNYAEAHYDLATALAALGGHETEALGEFESALRCRPGYAEAHNNIGAIDVRLGRMGEAARHFERALQLDPGLSEARDNLRAVLAARSP